MKLERLIINSFLMQPVASLKPWKMQREKEGNKMKELKMYMQRIEGKEKEVVFESTDKESIISWTITALFDGAVKRCNIKVDQYYEENIEYCRIKATYKRYSPDNTEIKEVYI